MKIYFDESINKFALRAVVHGEQQEFCANFPQQCFDDWDAAVIRDDPINKRTEIESINCV